MGSNLAGEDVPTQRQTRNEQPSVTFKMIYPKWKGKKKILLGDDSAACTPIFIFSEEIFLEERMLLNHKPSLLSVLTAS